jgi:hypothetical protein
MAKGLFHVSMIVSADALHAVTTAAAQHKASNVQIEPVLESKKRDDGEQSEPRIPVRTVLTPWMAKAKIFNIKDAIEMGSGLGYTKGAVYTAVLAAMKAGQVQRTTPGNYKTLAAINKAAKVLASANGGSTHGNAATQRKVNGVTHRDFVLQQISKGNVTYKSIIEAFKQDGRVPNSINGAVGKLKESKEIANAGPGEYKLLAKGSERLKSLT